MSSQTHLLEKAVKLHRSGQYTKASNLYQRILRENSRHSDAMHLLGVIAHQTGDDATAISRIQAAIALQSDAPEYYNNLGNALSRAERKSEAVSSYWRAVELRPQYFDALLNLGTTLRDIHRPDEGIRALRMALSLKPDHPDAHLRLAHCLEAVGRIDEAVEEYLRTLSVRPDDAAAYLNLGGSLFKSGHVVEANLAFNRSLALKPDWHHARSQKVAALNYRSDITAREVAEAHREWGRIHARPLTEAAAKHPAPGLSLDPERRLRVGYVSPNFYRHSVSHFFLPMLLHRDRAQFEIYLYSVSRLNDQTTAALRAAADGWRDVPGLSDEKLADLVRADGIDILVELAGHTGNNRLLTFARKPAPVQVTWLGYPQTTGVDAIDYRFTDAVTDPPGEADELSSEKLVRLPNGFHCFGRPGEESGHGCDDHGELPVAPLPARANGFVTFGSFNTVQKVSPALVALWSRVLKAVPDSRLLLKSLPDAVIGGRFIELFAKEGIEPERVVFLDMTAKRGDHLALYGRMDIGLDTFPYSGTTTTCEALWMGVPVLTLCGDRHASRVGASLLTRVGLEDWIAQDEEAYLAQAVRRAADLHALADLRAGLRERMRHSPLCDAAGFTRDLETAFRDCWRCFCQGAENPEK